MQKCLGTNFFTTFLHRYSGFLCPLKNIKKKSQVCYILGSKDDLSYRSRAWTLPSLYPSMMALEFKNKDDKVLYHSRQCTHWCVLQPCIHRKARPNRIGGMHPWPAGCRLYRHDQVDKQETSPGINVRHFKRLYSPDFLCVDAAPRLHTTAYMYHHQHQLLYRHQHRQQGPPQDRAGYTNKATSLTLST